MYNTDESSFMQLENSLKYDIQKYCNGEYNYQKCKKYFDKKMYKSLEIEEEMMHFFVISSFIRNYHVSKMGNPTINEARTNIALYASIKAGNFSLIEEFIETNDNIHNFLFDRYIANINNHSVDFNTMDETSSLLHNYHEYFKKKDKNDSHKQLKK